MRAFLSRFEFVSTAERRVMSGIEGAESAVSAPARRREPTGSARQPAELTNPRGTSHDASGHFGCRGMSYYSGFSGKEHSNLLKYRVESSPRDLAPSVQ